MSGPAMLQPSDIGRVVEAARRASLAQAQRIQSLPVPPRPVPIAPRPPARVLTPQAVQNCNPTLAVVRKPQTVVTSPTPDPVTPTPCPPTVTPVPQPTPTPVPTGTGTPTPAAATSSGTGINPWWRYQEENVPGGGHVMVNVGTGNMLLQDDDMSVPHKGIAMAFRRTYNSQASAAILPTAWGNFQSLYGNGWTNTFDARLVSQSATIKSVYDIDGARYDYSYNGSSTMTSLTPGQHATMVFDGGCGWLWTKKSGTTYYFYTMNPNATVTCPSLGTIGGYSGRLYQIIGRNHNTALTFHYSWDNGDASITGKIAGITATTESGQAATLAFADFSGRRLLQQLTFPDGATTVTYGYDQFGNLSSVSSPPNNSAGTRPQHWYGYNQSGSDYVMSYASSPRWAAACNVDNCGGDGAYLGFAYVGTGATSSMLSSIQHFALVNPTIPDGTAGVGIQSGYPTYAYAYSTEYYTTGVGTPTFRDTDGHMTNWVVDGAARPTQTQECTASAGQGTQCTGTWLASNESWNAGNDLTAESDPRGNETDYAHDANGDTVAVALPAVTVATPTGFATFRPTQLYDYDANYNVTAYCDARATHLSGHDWIGSGPAVSDSLCSTGAGGTPHATFAFTPTSSEPFGELTTITSPLGYSHHLAYNPNSQGGSDFGLPTDVSGDTIAQNDGTSRQPYTRYTYDQQGNVVCVAANANDQTTVHALAYDALNRLASVGDPDDASIASCSRTPGLPGSTIVTRSTYFPNGSKASGQSPSEAAKSVATQYTYDPDGNAATEIHHFGNVAATTTKWYDGEDRLIEVSQPRDTTDPLTYAWMTRYLYDLSNQGTAGASPVVNGATVAAYGNLFKTMEYMPPTTLGMPTPITSSPAWIDLRGTAFDALDRGTASYEAAFGNGPKESRAYDAGGQAGLLSQITNGANQVKTLAYDAIGRTTSETYSGDSGLTPNRTLVYDVSGKPSSIATTDLGAETYSYDAEGRETSKVEPTGGGVANPGTIGHTYYGDGLLKTTTIAASSLPIPASISMSYRADGRLTTKSLTDVNGSHTFGWTYTGGGRLTQRSDPLTGAAVSSVTRGGVTLVPQSYTYDGTGQLLTMTMPRNGSYSSVAHDAEAETTDFDAYQDRPSVNSWHQSMTYTARGELGTEVVQANGGGKTGNVQHHYAFGIDFGRGQNGDFRSGQVLTHNPSSNLSVGYGYDAAGRMQSSTSSATLTSGPYQSTQTGTFARAYDANNHLRSESVTMGYVNALSGCCASANTEYTMTMSYWPDGHAANVVSDAFSGTLHWDGDQLLYTGNMVYLGTDAVIGGSAGYPMALVYDRDWSGSAITSHWSYGGTTWYGAWGNATVKIPYNPNAGPNPDYPAPSSANDTMTIPTDQFIIPHANRTDGYTIGQVTLQGVRAYDAAAGQFMTPDAYVGEVHDPMSQKPFMWNRNNPYSYSDPSGYSPTTAMSEAGLRLLTVTAKVSAGVAAGISLGGTAVAAGILVLTAKPEPAGEVLPEGLVGSSPRQSSGKRVITQVPEGNPTPEEVFDKVGKSSGKPHKLPDGTQVAPNGVRYRPATPTKGARIDIPANGTKPPEGIHWPDPVAKPK